LLFFWFFKARLQRQTILVRNFVPWYDYFETMNYHDSLSIHCNFHWNFLFVFNVCEKFEEQIGLCCRYYDFFLNFGYIRTYRFVYTFSSRYRLLQTRKNDKSDIIFFVFYIKCVKISIFFLSRMRIKVLESYLIIKKSSLIKIKKVWYSTLFLNRNIIY
jgi:hypothetical protein